METQIPLFAAPEVASSWLVTGSILAVLALGFIGAPLLVWTATAAAILFLAGAPAWLWIAFAAVAVLFNIRPLRQVLVTSILVKILNKLQFLPKISETERVALKAGDVWIERELFSGKPNFKNLLNQKYPTLTKEEQAFMDNQVEKVCQMTNDWEVYKNRDLPPEVWSYLKKEGFLGMIIPKKYGGLEFSATAHSAVIQKLATRSVPLCVTSMVPNSLGPAELLIHYGTEEQKNHYLPRLARGEDLPCFALTEPNAGSDAASIQASGEVFKGDDGKLYLKLNWNKRWITLAAVSTVLGLAFRLRDPKNLLGRGEDLGITCALIPTKTPGVVANRRHDPLNVPFYNCPTQGKDVVVPIDAIIGGPTMAGRGWQMLMECLAAGRGISLPAQSAGGLKYVSRVAGAHAVVRKQFGMSIGRFEGVVEALARVSGFNYMVEAARLYTTGALDSHVKPPVVTAVMKYYTTEMSRKAINDGMDILGGAAISRGPRNLLAHAYTAVPISITVEGANILTRTLIIFGQGALRAHPYAAKEVEAIENNDLKAFDRNFWAHIGFVIRNTFRAVLLSLTRGYLVVPARGGVTAKYYRKLAWTSATFAFLADFFMASLGAKLKAKGRITGRMADILGHMYMATATLKRFEAEGRRKEDIPLLKWSLDHCFAEIQQAFDGLWGAVEAPLLGWLFRGPIRWYSAINSLGGKPSDKLDAQVAELIQRNSEQRERLTHGIFISKNTEEQMGRLEHAFVLSLQAEEASRKVKRAVRKGQLKKKAPAELYADALKAGIISQTEVSALAEAESARFATIQVDDFGLAEYVGQSQGGGSHSAGAGSGATSRSGSGSIVSPVAAMAKGQE